MIHKVLTVKGKILMTVLTVVLLFSLFILFYFPARQEHYLLKNYNDEIQNFANTVALGVKIALTEQNFEGVETAIDFVRHDERLVFVSLIQTDSVSAPDGTVLQIKKTVFKSFPEGVQVDPTAVSNELLIIKRAPFSTPMMSGEILLSFSTNEIIKSLNQIRLTSIVASFIVFVIGLVIGYLLARNISKPVLALRDAANRVGEGDLTQSVRNNSRDEIGELSIAFNKMVRDLRTEASLERVRNKAMAMRHSADIERTTAYLLHELNHIGLASEYSLIAIVDKAKKRADFWTTNANGDENSLTRRDLSLLGHPFLEGLLISWENKEPYSNVLQADDYHRYYEMIKANGIQLPEDSTKESSLHSLQYSFSAMVGAGALTVFRSKPLEAGSMRTVQRFADGFQLAYTRYQDLRKSEFSAIEKMKQSSLDRVRGEIASMRTKDDLKRITPIVWNELTSLGVPIIRCGVFIVNKTQTSLESYLSSPDGKSLAVFNLPFDASDIAREIIGHWKKGIVYKQHWDQKQFIAFMEAMIKQGRVENRETYQGATSPPKSLDLHFLPFSQGMLYVGSTSPLTGEELQLAQSLTDTFSEAYARYEDFVLLEDAKNETEKTLSELKSTQTQLIHAEKMASLGELTAGIAHEIQNPLNFVNNFSEVNSELINELEQELKKGNLEEIAAIAKNIKGNEQKIVHHGKRADAIVKGMLQHSRTSSGLKELTDINVLCDEYLRLAFHGLRAKDKSFSAKFETDLDISLPRINIVPQDIGRVILNLVNNAFYEVGKKQKIINDETYQPLVTLATRDLGSKIEITVQDNGPGIPEHIKERIFQPFFTTKPTGQGTGLGLSLAYDVVTKGHNGEVRVETKEGEGSTFIIILPNV